MCASERGFRGQRVLDACLMLLLLLGFGMEE